jgi:hypothetical protein
MTPPMSAKPGRKADPCGQCSDRNSCHTRVWREEPRPCARRALAERDAASRKWSKLCLAAQADGFKHRCLPGGPKMVDNNCPMCDLEHEANVTATAARSSAKGKEMK